MHKITLPYLLTVAPAVKIDRNGGVWTDRLWAKDLALHLEYIERLTVVCPHIMGEPDDSDVSLTGDPFAKIKFVLLPKPKSHLDALRLLPEMIRTMRRAVNENKIVHTGFGFWPISEGLLASPMAKLKKKFLITHVESSFWRVNTPAARLQDRIRAIILERLNGSCIRSANLRFFTSQAYLEDFLPKNAKSAYVTPATWIDESTVLDEQGFLKDCNEKTGPVRLLFAGRLTKDKGLSVLLDAARNSNPNVSLSIIGEGPLKAACEASANVELHAPLPYGADFFRFLRRYDAIIVPSLSDEQPRILFDAFSQGIPVLGSDTGGIREIVKDNINGQLFTPNSASILSDTINWSSLNRDRLQVMGREALRTVEQFTHLAMHRNRSEIISRELKGYALTDVDFPSLQIKTET